MRVGGGGHIMGKIKLQQKSHNAAMDWYTKYIYLNYLKWNETLMKMVEPNVVA